MPSRLLRLAMLLCLLALPGVLARPCLAQEAQPYDTEFEIPAVEKSPLEIWGQVELRMSGRSLDKDSAAYKQRFTKDPQEDTAGELLVRIKPEFSLQFEKLGAYARPRLDMAWSQLPLTDSTYDDPSASLFEDNDHWEGTILLEEGFLTWRPTESVTVEAGKKVLKWGKGYAWNPVSFASRPKDVEDPDQSREGYVLATADLIFSRPGPLATLAFTPVVLPVGEHINAALSDTDALLFGGKIYMLLYDVDVDLLALAGNGYDTRLGADFAANILENLAIHGETSLRIGYEKTLVNASGAIRTTRYNAWSALLGLRYLTSSDTTFILEYYHNGEGYSPSEMQDYFHLVNQGVYEALAADNEGTTQAKKSATAQSQSASRTSLLKQASAVSSRYNGSGAGQEYLYGRVSQLEPLGILYLTPSLTVIANLGDGSFTINPELSYKITENLEFRPRLFIPVGTSGSEYGEKMNALRGEVRLTYSF
ncbi:hypothetical protein [Megalodesulfovibrio paquesii]